MKHIYPNLKVYMMKKMEYAVISLAHRVLPLRVRCVLKRYLYKDSFVQYVIKKTIGGLTFNFLIGDTTGEEWYGGNDCASLSPEWEFAKQMVREGDTVFDVGAHHGFFSILMAQWVGKSGKVVAFEPSIHNFKILEKNIELNHLSNVIAINKAVGAFEGIVSLRDEHNSVVVERTSYLTSVSMTTLDAYSGCHPNFIKIDVEGFEVDVLRGASKILEMHPGLNIEIHLPELQHRGYGISSILDFLSDKSYTLWIQDGADRAPVLFYGGSPTSLSQVHLFARRERTPDTD